MLGKLPTEQQQTMWAPPLEMMLNSDHQLAKCLPWDQLEAEFGGLYAPVGRPSIPIRVMVSLLLLQRMFDESNEQVVKEWVQTSYWRHFSGMTSFQWKIPCDPTELIKTRNRIGWGRCREDPGLDHRNPFAGGKRPGRDRHHRLHSPHEPQAFCIGKGKDRAK